VQIFLCDEFRLAYALILQAAILVAAWRFVARRIDADWADRATDVLLLGLLVQYLSVALPGIVGILNPATIAITTIALSAALYFAPIKRPIPVEPLQKPINPLLLSDKRVSPDRMSWTFDGWFLLGCTLFAAGYVADLAWNQLYMPVMANDALTYHFPAAVHWLATGRLGLFEAWYFNPANTYSPLAGSTFIAWWMAPIGNDVLARYVQTAPLLLIFFAAMRLMRALGARTVVAALLALALLASKPFLRQSQIEKDDLFLTAFFACGVAGFSRERLADRLGAWRIGVALGLLVATKFTALMALPALLLAADAPWRAGWRWRRYAVAAGVALLLAGPWYLRNLIVTGNPLFPVEVKIFGMTIFHGILPAARSSHSNGVAAIWSILTGVDQSLPDKPMIVLLCAMGAAWVGAWRRVRAEPLVRLCLLGPWIALIVFIRLSPHSEARYVYPAFFLLFASAAIALAAWRNWLALQIVAAVVVLNLALFTAFPLDPDRLALIFEMITSAAIFVVIGLVIAWAALRFQSRRPMLLGCGSGALALLLAAAIYVYWQPYLNACRQVAFEQFYPIEYGIDLSNVWKYVRDEIPATQTLAYANTFMIHPMSGFSHDRPLVYVPTRRGIKHLQDLPALANNLSGEDIVPAASAALTVDTDADGWLARLGESGATHLVVFHHDAVDNPPELEIVAAHPERFTQVFQNPVASVYQLRK
jgi:4-amino-4-deoxy-L-arabinose transferase-like glycosyltransferase